MQTIPNRIVLVTDAMAAAGAPDGDYMLGELPRGPRLSAPPTIAGSTLALDRASATESPAGYRRREQPVTSPRLATAMESASTAIRDFIRSLME